jgi:quercetin dioxygenase-like cupin family protein
MAIPHAQPGQVVDVRPLGARLTDAQTTTLIKSHSIEVIRLVMPAGKEIAEHRTAEELIVQCVEGKVAFTAMDKTQELTAGHLLFLGPAEPHSVKAIEDASLLLTIVLGQSKSQSD